MSGRKQLKPCARCHEPKVARYRTLLDEYLCDACYETPKVETGVLQAGPAMAATPEAEVPALDVFDLSHLVER